MSDESYSPGSDLSSNDHQDNLQYSATKKYSRKVSQFKHKLRCSSEADVISMPRNRSYSASDSQDTGRIRYRSRSESKLTSTLTRVKQLQRIEKTAQIIDVEHFQKQLNTAHVCSGARLKFIPDTSAAVGSFHQNSFECSKCHNRTDASNFPPKNPIRSTVQEPNARLYAASAATGIGYEGISTLMASLCLSITTKKHFIQQTYTIHSNLHEFAQKQFQLLINNIRQSANIHDIDSVLNVYVSIDGTWKRRGHISNYGIVFLIHVETGYCIDYEVLSLRCETCDVKKSQLTAKQIESWFKSHKLSCSKNYDGTSKGMEAEGASRIFRRSLSKSLRYKWLVCDGDSSTYDRVKNIYIEQETADEDNTDDDPAQHDNELNTGFQEMISGVTLTAHDRKKMKTDGTFGTTGKSQQPKEAGRVRKTLVDGKPFGGSVGRMTDATMHKMSEMYGLAIRQGADEGQDLGEDEDEIVDRLQKKCLAAFHHLIVHENKEDQHYYCPDGALSWCSYKRDQVINKNEDEIKNKNRLDPVFLELLQKMINDLTSKELLSRCVRGLTQNSNESLNSVVWSILSKSKYHGFSSIQGAAAAATVYFNGGRSSLLEFFQQSGIEINEDLYLNLMAKDEKRIKKAEQIVEQRQILIANKSRQRLQSMQAANDTSEYGSGSFHD
ncbi:unnamed protein product [Rotaria sordida]|uniref:Mutator-like transposase domain-containing protein n=1 Tax=Rotaria sordida TaxID=392033 RepID=A0A815TVG9_9BILA|nr:unnamed protein product [Rotaria sordida]